MLPYRVEERFAESVGGIENVLGEVLTRERLTRFQGVLAKRSRKVMSIFESTDHSHNISAVLRTCDAMGFQDACFVYEQPGKPWKSNGVERGSSNWLTLRRAFSIAQLCKVLKRAGYQILLVSSPDFEIAGAHYQDRIPVYESHRIDALHPVVTSGNPVALVFGNEKIGLTSVWNHYADAYLRVSMVGFVESMNLSVIAGIVLHQMRSYLVTGEDDLINSFEKSLVKDLWISRNVPEVREHIKRLAPEMSEYLEYLLKGMFFTYFDERET